MKPWNHCAIDRLWCYKVGYHLLRRYPRFVGEWVGRLVSTGVYVLTPAIRKALRDNLQTVKKESYRRGDGLTTINNYGRYLCDFFRLPALRDTEELRQRFHDPFPCEALQELRKRGKGVILFSIHLGNWEGAAHLLQRNGIPINFFIYHDAGEKLDRQLAEYRRQRGLKLQIINREHAALKAVLKVLKNNEVVGILGDRDPLGTGPETDFFGRRVRLPYGPVGLSRVTGAPILPAFVPQIGDRYRLIFEEPIAPPPRGRAAEAKVAQQLIGLMENYIRQYPEQWYNFFPVFE